MNCRLKGQLLAALAREGAKILLTRTHPLCDYEEYWASRLGTNEAMFALHAMVLQYCQGFVLSFG